MCQVSNLTWTYTSWARGKGGRPLNVMRGPLPPGDPRQLKSKESDLRPFFWIPPPRCPYRPLISYKIGQMPTVTRGG